MQSCRLDWRGRIKCRIRRYNIYIYVQEIWGDLNVSSGLTDASSAKIRQKYSMVTSGLRTNSVRDGLNRLSPTFFPAILPTVSFLGLRAQRYDQRHKNHERVFIFHDHRRAQCLPNPEHPHHHITPVQLKCSQVGVKKSTDLRPNG